MERFSITPADIAAAREYRAAMQDSLLAGTAADVPMPDELVMECIASRALARVLPTIAATKGVDLTAGVDAEGWPPVCVIERAGRESESILAVVSETSMVPRPVWPVRIREILVSGSRYDAYVSVWMPAVAKLEAPDRQVQLQGTIAGWLGPEEVAHLPLAEVQPHFGDPVGGTYRQCRVAQLRTLEVMF